MRPNMDALVDAMLAEVLVHAMRCARLYGSVHLALSAESDLDPVYRRLMYDPPMRGFPWEQTHIWVYDEPGGTRHTRAATLRAWFEHHSGIPEGRILGPGDVGGTEAFEARVRGALGERGEHEDRLDLVVLGLQQTGPREALPGAVFAGGPGEGASGFTLEAVNRARLVTVFAGGAAARDRVQAMVRGADHPLARVKPEPGLLRWFVDHAACGAE